MAQVAILERDRRPLILSPSSMTLFLVGCRTGELSVVRTLNDELPAENDLSADDQPLSENEPADSSSAPGLEDATAPGVQEIRRVTFSDTPENDVLWPDDLLNREGQFGFPDIGAVLRVTVDGAVATAVRSGFTHRVNGTYSQLWFNERTGDYRIDPKPTLINALSGDQEWREIFAVTASDGTPISNLEILVTGADDRPIQEPSPPFYRPRVVEGGFVRIESHHLSWADIDSDLITFEVVEIRHGKLILVEVPLAGQAIQRELKNGDRFTDRNLLQNILIFQHDHSERTTVEITYRVVGVVDDQTHVINVDLYNDNPPVLSESGSQTLVINDGMSANEVQDTGYSFGATDSDIGDVVTITVDDDRFHIADDGRLQLKASQNFTKAEAVAGKVQLKITVTDDGAPDTLTDSRTVDITITPAQQPSNAVVRDGTGNTTRDVLDGAGGTVDHFKVDNDYARDPAKADVITNFRRADGDKIDLPDSDFPDGTTVYYEASNALTDDDENEVVLYKDQAKTEVIAIIDDASYVP